MISARIAQSEVRARMQGFNLHKLNVMKSKDNKNVQTAQVTQEVPQLPMKNAVLYVKQLCVLLFLLYEETTYRD